MYRSVRDDSLPTVASYNMDGRVTLDINCLFTIWCHDELLGEAYKSEQAQL